MRLGRNNVLPGANQMTKLEIDIAGDLADWAAQNAARHGLSLDAYIEMLIGLESGLASTVRDGRTLQVRALSYRDADNYFSPGDPTTEKA